METDADIINQSLIEKVRSLEAERLLIQSGYGKFVQYFFDRPHEQQLDFVKFTYKDCFDEDMWGDDPKRFEYGIKAIKPLWECADDKEFALKINDYLFCLTELDNQIKYAGEVYDPDAAYMGTEFDFSGADNDK